VNTADRVLITPAARDLLDRTRSERTLLHVGDPLRIADGRRREAAPTPIPSVGHLR
jgi:hypothetical protein